MTLSILTDSADAAGQATLADGNFNDTNKSVTENQRWLFTKALKNKQMVPSAHRNRKMGFCRFRHFLSILELLLVLCPPFWNPFLHFRGHFPCLHIGFFDPWAVPNLQAFLNSKKLFRVFCF